MENNPNAPNRDPAVMRSLAKHLVLTGLKSFALTRVPCTGVQGSYLCPSVIPGGLTIVI